MNIEPTYVTFEQGKLLKEKGFDIKVEKFFDLLSNTKINNAALANYNLTKYAVSIPEQWVVIEWLLLNYRIDIIIKYPESNTNKVEGINSVYYDLEIYRLSGGDAHKLYKFIEVSDKKQKAYSVAIDYVLNNLI